MLHVQRFSKTVSRVLKILILFELSGMISKIANVRTAIGVVPTHQTS